MRMTGRQAVLEILRCEGVEYIFGVPGATEILFMDALEDCPDMKYVLELHEVVVAGMAEGYARTSGKVGVLNLHTGTGLSAALPLLSNAHQGGVPLVITAGQQDTRLLAYEPALAGGLVRLPAWRVRSKAGPGYPIEDWVATEPGARRGAVTGRRISNRSSNSGY